MVAATGSSPASVIKCCSDGCDAMVCARGGRKMQGCGVAGFVLKLLRDARTSRCVVAVTSGGCRREGWSADSVKRLVAVQICVFRCHGCVFPASRCVAGKMMVTVAPTSDGERMVVGGCHID